MVLGIDVGSVSISIVCIDPEGKLKKQAYMLGGLFRKTSCRIRPYESVPGQTDAVFEEVHKLLVKAMGGDQSIDSAISEGLRLVDGIEYDRTLRKPPVINPRALEKQLSAFNIHLYHSGESYDNILKTFYILKNYPDVALFVQTNPSFCCPSLVTEAMTRQIRQQTGVPIVTITYDGTSETMNDSIVPYIQKKKRV